MRGPGADGPLTPADLSRHACLRFPPLWRDGHWHLLAKRQQARVPVTGTQVANRAEVLRAAALGGLGIAMLPTWVVAEDARSTTLRLVLRAWAPPASVIHAFYPGNRRVSAKVRAFVDHLDGLS